MKMKTVFLCLLAALFVLAGTPPMLGQATPTPTHTRIPTSTKPPTRTPTRTPTVTPTATVGPAQLAQFENSRTVWITAPGTILGGTFISHVDATVAVSGGEVKCVLGRYSTVGQVAPCITSGPIEVWGAASTTFPRGATVSSDNAGHAQIATGSDFVAGYVAVGTVTGGVPGPIRIVLLPGVAVLATFTNTPTKTPTRTPTVTPTH